MNVVSTDRTIIDMRFAKYGNVHTGNGFPSKLEAAVYQLLCLREKAGEIKNIERQQTIVLQDGDRGERITWKVDFGFTEVSTNERVIVEAKGMETETYRLKLKLYRRAGTHKLEIWKGSHLRPYLYETIVPRGL